MATTDNELNDLIINDISQEEYDNLVATGQVQEGQIYATDGEGSGGGSTTGGLESVAHDSSLEGAGTTASPLRVASTVIAQINDKADGTVVETLSSVVSENTTKLNTLRNDTDSLGDQVSGIEEKIPSSASATNQLATKADLPIGFDATVVTELPATGEKGIIYLVPKDGEAPDVHDEYIWIDSEQKFELIGSTAVDLTDYVKNTDYAAGGKPGVIKVSAAYGFALAASNGYLTGVNRSLEQYNSAQTTTVISKGALENIKNDLVKRAVTENDITLTDDEKTAAQDWLGIKQGASLPILMAMWSDHVINDMSWLRADTFSWQSGDTYKAAYEHLVGDLASVPGTQYYAWLRYGTQSYYTTVSSPDSGDTIYYKNASGDMVQIWTVMEGGSQTIYNDGGDELVRDSTKDETVLQKQTETIGDITITYCLADDGHKICLPDQEANVQALYEATGVAWYYILDTENKQFKLPRTKYGFTGLRDSVGGYVAPGLPNITGSFTASRYGTKATSGQGAFGVYTSAAQSNLGSGNLGVFTMTYPLSASDSNPIYGNSDTVQSPATQMYLYFYVGNFEQSAVEQTAGLNTEMFNDLNAHKVIDFQVPTSANGYTWYRKYADGWVEQGGIATTNGGNATKITLPIEMLDGSYIPLIQGRTGSDGYSNAQWQIMPVSTTASPITTTSFFAQASITGYNLGFCWEVKGMAK